jgi:hypothetical protein
VLTGEKSPYVPCDKHSPKTEVYASISSMGIAGPVFVDGPVNSDVYIEDVLPTILFQVKKRTKKTSNPTTTRMVPNVRNFVFQQDLATSHTSRKTQEYLQDCFPNFLPKKSTPPVLVEWPIEMFWNQVKQEVYSEGKPKNMIQLKNRISKVFENFDIDWLKKAWNTMPERMEAVIVAQGGHTEY